MMFKWNKRAWIMTGLIALLFVAVFVNYNLNASKDDVPTAASPQEETETLATSGFFMDFKLERKQVREQEVAYLDSIIANAATDQETLATAQNKKMELASAMELEVTIEGLLRAKGISDAVVTFHKGSVNVVVNEASLTDAQVAQVVELVQRETGEAIENIKIIPVYQ